ncbi:MAG: hypothetical protein KDJ31_06495 [Candidatus Competibacteraceae bacterium]|nr:hypothetical protein [Candidatus Competibacteraceae bacterium]MCB1822824.1 hypothetical protein [Candidatus Competibacteraceae bacterium]HRY16445.1 hypothetical protein [Candidatus Competibacteraceae bacterium]
MAHDFIGQALNLGVIKNTAITYQKSVFQTPQDILQALFWFFTVWVPQESSKSHIKKMNAIVPGIPKRLHLLRLPRNMGCIAVLHIAAGR